MFNNKHISNADYDDHASCVFDCFNWVIIIIYASCLMSYSLPMSLKTSETFSWKRITWIPATCTAVLLYAGKPVSTSMANVELELLNYPDVPVLVHWKRRSRCYFWNQKCTTFKLSSYRKQLSEYLYLGNATVLKLVPNLQNKTNYVVHYRNLISYIFTIGRGVVWSWARSTEC